MNTFVLCKKFIKKSLRYGIIFLTALYLIKMLFTTGWINVSLTAIKVFVATILPSVLPFAILTTILKLTVKEDNFALKLDKLTKKVFKISGYGFTAIIFALLSGYPSGGAIANEYLKSDKLDIKTAKRVFAITNVPSPLLIITCIGGITYKSIVLGVIMFFSIMIATKTATTILFSKSNDKYKSNFNKKYIKTGQTIENGVQSAIKSIIVSGGLTCLFYLIADSIFSLSTSVFLPQFFAKNNTLLSIFLGFIETTRGASQFSFVLSPLSASACLFTLILGGAPIWILNFEHAKKLKIKTARLILFKALQSVLGFFVNYFAFLLYLL